MDLGISGKRVLVTGASQGIGEAIARAFADEGCQVSLIARRDDVLKEVVDSIGGTEAGHAWYAADLMEPGAPTEAVNALIAQHGDFDIVIHNVGGTLGVRDVLSPPSEWFRVLQFNVGIAMEINAIVIPPMKEKQWGRVVHVSSISAEALRGSAPYGTSKACLNAYVKTLARDVAPHNVVCSALLPGAIYAEGGHWDNLRKTKPEIEPDFLRHHHAIGRLGTAEEIAPFAVFMAADQVTFASGSMVPIDGGTM